MTTESGEQFANPMGAATEADPAPARRVRSGSPPGRTRGFALHFVTVLLGSGAIAAAVGGFRAGLSMALGVTLAGANLLLMQKITSYVIAANGDEVAGRVSESRASGGDAVSATSPASGDAASGGGTAGGAMWALALPFKLAALVGVAYALVSFGVAQPVPFAMGFALLPLTGVFLRRPSSVLARSRRR